MDFNKVKKLINNKDIVLDIENADEHELRVNYKPGDDSCWMEFMPEEYRSEEELVAAISTEVKRKSYTRNQNRLKLTESYVKQVLANEKIMRNMNQKDKILLKDSIRGVADEAVDQIATKLPGLNIAWSLAKALFGAGLKLRQQKALEWIEMVRDNPGIFTKELLEQGEFQDAFVYSLEKYLTERVEEKRQYFRNIFLGYAAADSKDAFPLEKFIHTLSQVSTADIKVLKDVDISRMDKNYQIYGNKNLRLSNIYNLINLGVLHTDPSSRLGPVNAPFVWISEFGKEFIKYLKR